MEKLKKTIGEFAKKYKHILWIAGILLFLLFAAVYVYQNDVGPASREPYRVMDRTSQDTDLGVLQQGTVKQQFVSIPESIDRISLQFQTFDYANQGSVDVSIQDTATGTVYVEQSVAMGDIPAQGVVDFVFSQKAEGVEQHTFLIELEFRHQSDQNRITLWASNAPAGGSHLEVAGQPVQKELSFQAYSGTNSFLKPVFFAALAFVLLCAAALYLLIFVFRAKIHQVFLVVVFMVAILYGSLLTPFSVPDEGSHIDMAYRYSNGMLSKGHGIPDRNMLKRGDDIQKTQFLKTTPDASMYRRMAEEFFGPLQDETLVETSGESVGAVPWLYLPSAAGLTIGRLLHLGTFPMLYLGRLFNLLTFALCVFFAIKKAPLGKMIFFAAALLPMTVQLAFSFSYDAVINGLAFLFVANCLSLAYGTERIKRRDIILLCVLGILLAPCKNGAYLPICFFSLIIPKRRFEAPKQYWLFLAALLATSVLSFGIHSFSAVFGVASAEGAGHIIPWAGSPGYTIGFIFSNPLTFLRMLINTLVQKSDFYVTSLLGKELGWFDIPIHLTVIVVFLILLLLSSLKKQDEPQSIKLSSKLWIALLCVGVFLIVELGMFTGWTPLGFSTIEGVQGRYFLPILPLLLLLVRNSNLTLQKSIDRPIMYGVFLTQVFAVGSIAQTIL